MKTVNIFLVEKYNKSSRIGEYAYYLSCNGAVKKVVGAAGDLKSPTQTVLIALVKALEQLNQPCKLVVYSKVKISFSNISKSPHKELLKKIQEMMFRDGHHIELGEMSADEIDRTLENWEKQYGKPVVKNKKPTVEDVNNKFKVESVSDEASNSDWRAMYSDLMGPSEGCWIPGSGGY